MEGRRPIALCVLGCLACLGAPSPVAARRPDLPTRIARPAVPLPEAPRPRPLPAFPSAVLAQARALRDRALQDPLAFDLLSSLTTEVGPRLAGSPGDAGAVAWAVDRMRALGLSDVRAEPVTVPHWIRGDARVEITAPWPQALSAVALGGSVGTPPGGIEAEVVRAASLDEVKALPRERVEGRIVFLDGRMERLADGSGYGRAVGARSRGAIESAKPGAVAVVIRTVGTGSGRSPHTGAMRLADGVPPIPAFAIAHPDANLLDRELDAGRPVRLRVSSTSRWADPAPSANVIGEVRGRESPGEIVLLAAHLDSWDLGTGAHDDGAGVATILAAAKALHDLPLPPRRTVRVVLFANEEMGLSGSDAYRKAHGTDRHVLAAECDAGAFPFRAMAARVSADRRPVVDAIRGILAPLGIPAPGDDAHGGADIGFLRDAGVPLVDLRTDCRPYFDLHHGADDVLDAVDPAVLRAHAAAYTVLAFLAAEAEGDWGRVPPDAEK